MRLSSEWIYFSPKESTSVKKGVIKVSVQHRLLWPWFCEVSVESVAIQEY